MNILFLLKKSKIAIKYIKYNYWYFISFFIFFIFLNPRSLKKKYFLKEAGRFEMKNCLKIVFLSEVIHHHTVFFWCLSKSLFSIFQFPLHMNFQRNIFDIFFKPLSISEFAGSKNICMSIQKKCINRYCTGREGGQSQGGMSN